MPTYEYKCEECDHYFTKFLKIPDRDLPTSEACPACGKKRVVLGMFSPPSIGDPVRLGIRRPDQGFREVLQKIHQAHPGSRMNTESRYI